MARLLCSVAALLFVAGCGSNKSNSACSSGTTMCASRCVDTSADAANCGACGKACASGQRCSSGACAATCASGYSVCGSGATAFCANTMSDNANCGSCANACGPGQICSSGVCAGSCPTGQAVCGSGVTLTCANLQTDGGNCGRCGIACAAGLQCISGMCMVTGCPTSQIVCGSGPAMMCTNPQTDVNNCGGCAMACASGQLCTATGCADSCPGTLSACPAAGTPSYCTDLKSDPNNCGACGTVCPGGQGCVNGACSCGFTNVYAGHLSTCGLKNGTVSCWGILGGSGGSVVGYGPSPVVLLSSVTAFAGGDRFNCAIKTDQSVWCWGANDSGQLGNNTTTTSLTPVQVLTAPATPLANAVTIGAGRSHACIANTTGELWCWGQDNSGELGDDMSTNSPVAVKAQLPGGVLAGNRIAGGDAHTCILSSTGDVYCWGNNDAGQLGLGNTTPQPIPTKIASLSMMIDLASYTEHTCAVKMDNSAWCWGNNDNGQIGIGNTTTPQNAPVQVLSAAATNLTNVAAISVGEEHTCALESDGTVWCWGQDNHSQLGDNGTTTQPFPAQVLLTAGGAPTFFTGATTVAAGHRHTCATSGALGQVFCWGRNVRSQGGIPAADDLAVATSIARCNP